LQEFFILCSRIWKDIFSMIRIIFWGVKEAGSMKKVSAYFAKSGKDILLSHVIVFNVILLLIQ